MQFHSNLIYWITLIDKLFFSSEYIFGNKMGNSFIVRMKSSTKLNVETTLSSIDIRQEFNFSIFLIVHTFYGFYFSFHFWEI